MKLLICGHGRHGKDTVGEILRDDYNLKFTSSSLFCAEKVMMPAFIAEKERLGDARVPTYATAQDCYDNRHHFRAFWFDRIRDYCSQDPARLSRDIFAVNDVYCGIRSKEEFHASRNEQAFDVSIWVDATDRLQTTEGKDSMQIEPWMCDYVLYNNGTIDQLHREVARLMTTLRVPHKTWK